jgi:hypothetical protein
VRSRRRSGDLTAKDEHLERCHVHDLPIETQSADDIRT